MRLWGCVHRLDFVRNALKEGLVEEVRMGVNPYMLGIMASTDTHNGTPGHVRSAGFPGHVGVVDDTADKRLGAGNVTHDGVINNPGGLTGVWAMENSRDAIFEALRRREVFGTSGPRIQPRLFGGWGYSSGLCATPDKLAGHGYDGGVPMGDVLAALPAGGTPSFIVQATADGGTKQAPGARLERIQVVKLWVDAKGLAHEKVYEVAGKAVSLESVDVKTCKPSGLGKDSLCAVWKDPDFKADEPAVYYARVLEVPTCRWSTLRCLELAADKKVAGCQEPNIAPVIRERAWTSPIWYRP
jgi:hypothetical protein